MVGQFCCVLGCNSKSHDAYGTKLDHDIRFYAFPVVKKHLGRVVEDVTARRRMAWVSAVRRTTIIFERISSAMKICSLHFHKGMYCVQCVMYVAYVCMREREGGGIA